MLRRTLSNPFAVLLLLLHSYIALRLLPPFALPAQVAGAAVLALSYYFLPKGWFVPQDRGPLSIWLPWLTMGFFSWLFVLTVARDASLIVAAFTLSTPLDDEWTRQSAIGVMLLTPVVTGVGIFMARRVAPVFEVNVPIAGLPPGLEGFTIAQISDIHVGPTIKGDFVARIVERVNQLRPDMVAITGDLVDGHVRDLAKHTQPLADLASRHGTYFVTGNHEYYSGAHTWIRELRRLGARVLMNEHVVIDHNGASLAVAGVTDYSAHHFDTTHRSDPQAALAGAPEHAVKVLLAHQPRSAAGAAEAGFQLQLSGHTHGGQFWPWHFFVRLQQPFTAGLHRLGGMWIYVNRGTGYWGPPQRFGIPSEITRLRLVKA